MPERPCSARCGGVTRTKCNYCRDCDNRKKREAYAAQHGVRERTRTADRYGRAKEHIRSLKEGKVCQDCGVGYPPYVLQFDHRPGESKIAALARLVGQGVSNEKIDAEVAKCDLVCANCHAIRTYQRRAPHVLAA